MTKIAVGSANAAKHDAVRLAFSALWPEQELDVIGCEIVSAVDAQPMSDQESITGAIHRADEALRQQPEAEYGIGLEGGLQEVDGRWYECGWIAVRHRDGRLGIGASPKVIVPPKAMKLIQSGTELGEVTDILFGTESSKTKQGYFGLITNGAITRRTGYSQGVIMALAAFLHPDLFKDSMDS